MNRTLKATAAIMLMMIFAAGCTKPNEPNNGGVPRRPKIMAITSLGARRDRKQFMIGLPTSIAMGISTN